MVRLVRLRCLRYSLPLVLVAALFVPTARGEKPGASDLARYDSKIKLRDRQHWAFRPVRRPAVPIVRNTAWVRNPIDAFVLARLEARGWKPSPPAEPRALLRRLYLDLIGLPPTPAEQEAFLKNSSQEALDRVAAELLARPAYGERWARHWLDLVRYAETNGYERDGTKPSVWRYRDYVIRAFNADKPYDRFLTEQLAGDELPDASPETLIATGYCRLGPWDDEPADPQEDRFDQLDDMVSTTSLVFLGLTLGCARCHDHKFEALTQLDYYRMVAIFDPLQRPQYGRMELDVPLRTRAETERARRKALTCRLAGLGSLVPAAGPLSPPSALVSLRLSAEARQILTDGPHGYFMQESSPNPPPTHLLLRGKATRPGPVAPAGMPAVLVEQQPAFLKPGPSSSFRRLTLARWIARPDNPLTARVMVNRIWQFHFGEGLVPTPSDFGVMGQSPTHPELLDWLADWFVREGWSVKKLHRLIVTSNAYRMSKKWNPEYGAQDPENRLLWRVHYRRLEVEAIRDAMLAVSGQLNAQMFGPSMYPQVPREALLGHSDPTLIWKPFDEKDASRRTVYAFIKRSMVVPMLEVLDLCDTTRSSARRVVTTVAPQALTLFNGDFVNREAEHLANRLEREAGSDPGKQVVRAYRLALCRPPSASERDTLVQFLEREAGRLTRESAPTLPAGEARHRALQQMCRVLFNLNEFVYAD
jgi:hypothetical protein